MSGSCPPRMSSDPEITTVDPGFINPSSTRGHPPIHQPGVLLRSGVSITCCSCSDFHGLHHGPWPSTWWMKGCASCKLQACDLEVWEPLGRAKSLPRPRALEQALLGQSHGHHNWSLSSPAKPSCDSGTFVKEFPAPLSSATKNFRRWRWRFAIAGRVRNKIGRGR